MEKTMPKGLKHLDLSVDILPAPVAGDAEVVVKAGDLTLLEADVETTGTTVDIFGLQLEIDADLTALLPPLDALERQLESLKNNDLRNLEFSFDWAGGTDLDADFELVIDRPGNQDDETLLEGTIAVTATATGFDTAINIEGLPEITLTGVNLAPLFPVLDRVDELV
jgi:hypothetical protein